MTDKKNIEKALRRRAGMSPERLNAMHSFSDTVAWSGRCWNCREPFTALRDQIGNCRHCGVDLRKRG